MPDPISPQELEKLIETANDNLIEENPIAACCIIFLLTSISDKWDSGQMEEDLHSDLIEIKEEIENILNLSEQTLITNQLSQLLKEKVIPLRLIHWLK